MVPKQRLQIRKKNLVESRQIAQAWHDGSWDKRRCESLWRTTQCWKQNSPLGSHTSLDVGKTPGEAIQSQFTQICNRKKGYDKKTEVSSSSVWKWKMNLDAYKVATQCSFLIMKVNNPPGTWQVIPGNVRFGYHSSFLLSPFLNITPRKEIHRKRIRLLISRVPALYSAGLTGWSL